MSGTILPGERRTVPVSVMENADAPALSSPEQCGPLRIRRDDLLHGEQLGQTQSTATSLIAFDQETTTSLLVREDLDQMSGNADLPGSLLIPAKKQSKNPELSGFNELRHLDDLFSDPLEMF